MTPKNLEVGLHGVVRRTFLTHYSLKIAEVEVTGVFISLGVGRCRPQAPRAFCIDFAGKCEVDIIVDGEIIAAVAEIEASVVVVTERRHDDT